MPGVAVVSVPVTDQDRAATFYCTYLGFSISADAAMGPTMRWVQLAAGDERTTLTLTTWFERLTPGVVQGLVLDVADPDATRAAMMAGGVEVSELEDQPWGRFFTCEDPDGNGLIVARVVRGR